MDQDAFRNLLASGSSSHTRQSVAVNDYKRKNKKKEIEGASGPAFKPRTHKKPEETYRDRATERRGGANDFADVEKVLENFERVNANTDAELIEEQRKMLGGDEKHTVLVKGLDFALLEQQKAKIYESQDADDEMALEQVFQELSSPKKKTREELVAGLKKARSEGIPVDKPLEVAKQQGKFRPIGAQADTKAKKRKAKGDEKVGEKKKKKKRKLEDAADVQGGASNAGMKEESISSSRPIARARTPSPEVDPDADIFGDADEYRGLSSGSDAEEEEGEEPRVRARALVPPRDSIPRNGWFSEKLEPDAGSKPISKPQTHRTKTPEDHPMVDGPEAEPEEQDRLRPVVRLQALASSSVPSVRDILAMDEAAEREEKRKAKKEKRKKKNPTEETKINREVKQLEQYVATKSK